VNPISTQLDELLSDHEPVGILLLTERHRTQLHEDSFLHPRASPVTGNARPFVDEVVSVRGYTIDIALSDSTQSSSGRFRNINTGAETARIF
jgi:hypothetical protein